MLHRPLALAMALVAAACTPAGGPSPTPAPSPAPTTVPGSTILPGPSGGGALDPAQLRLVLMDTLGPRWYCDPDQYPVVNGDEQQRAIERYPEMVAENELYRAIAERLDIDPDGPVTDTDKLAIYRVWKPAISLELTALGSGRWRFDYLSQPTAEAPALRTSGVIDDLGQITVEEKAPAEAPNCPICLVVGTPIDGPDGPVPVEGLRVGDRIWTLDGHGRRVAGTVLAVGSTTAPRDHRVVRLILADGRTVTASPGHPLADGRKIGGLDAGDPVDGSTVASISWLPYGHGRTFDLLVSGGSGAYLAGGIPLGSTLSR